MEMVKDRENMESIWQAGISFEVMINRNINLDDFVFISWQR